MFSGRASMRFWETSKSASDSRPPSSSGSLSILFSDTSRHNRLFMLPISWSSESSKMWRHLFKILIRNIMKPDLVEFEWKFKTGGGKLHHRLTAGISANWFPSSHRSFKPTRWPIDSGYVFGRNGSRETQKTCYDPACLPAALASCFKRTF